LDIRVSDELYSGFLLCEEKVNKGDWAYYCEGCYFVAHMSCSNPEVRPLYTDLLSENPIYSIVREESNRNESEMDIEASSSKTQDIGRGNFEQMPIDLERGRARKIERGSEKSNMADAKLNTVFQITVKKPGDLNEVQHCISDFPSTSDYSSFADIFDYFLLPQIILIRLNLGFELTQDSSDGSSTRLINCIRGHACIGN
jgi:hypothetical protein